MVDNLTYHSTNPIQGKAIGMMVFVMNGSIAKYLFKTPPAWMKGVLGTALEGLDKGTKAGGHAMAAVLAVFVYTLVLTGALCAMDVESEG